MEPPVYVYYELENFYQNHRRYVKSRDDVQLREGKLLTASDLSDCEPLIQSQNGTKSPIRHPCGLIAGSFFNGMCARSRACLVERVSEWFLVDKMSFEIFELFLYLSIEFYNFL